MCGRYTIRHIDQIQQRFAIDEVIAEATPRYNAAPTQLLPVITCHNGKRRLEMMKWGLVPSWAKNPRPAFATINARSEEVATKPAFRQPLRTQRCIVPSDGFYEWMQQGKTKQPYFIHMQDDSLFGFAGLYDIYVPPLDSSSHQPAQPMLKSFTIITTSANATIAPLHPRMDVILDRDDETLWLDPLVTDAARIDHLFRPYLTAPMEVYPVSQMVNGAHKDSPGLIARVQLPSLPNATQQQSLF